MRVFEAPTSATLLLGLCLLWGTPTAQGDFVFGAAVNLGPTVNSSANDFSAVLSPDGLELYFSSDRPGGFGWFDVWVRTRATVQDAWGPPTNLGPQINTPDWDAPTSMSADGLTLYLDGQGPLQMGAGFPCTITRATRDAPWGPRVRLDPAINLGKSTSTPIISADGLELFFSSSRPGGSGLADIWVARRTAADQLWDAPVNLGPTVNGNRYDAPTWISPDGLTLLFLSTRAEGYGTVDMWISRRPSNDGAWGLARNLGPSVNTKYPELITAVSADGRSCYVSDYGLGQWGPRPDGLGGSDLWLAPTLPIVDFNADGKVDLDDLRLLIDSWGTDNTLYDIGPFAWGDGKVDIEDLKVFMAEWEKENPPLKP